MSFVYWEEMGAMWLVVKLVDVEKEDCVLISSSSSWVVNALLLTMYVNVGLWFFIFLCCVLFG
jgi:hypothetical protein